MSQYFSVATYNIGDGKTSRKVLHLTRLVKLYGVSVIGCQEAGDRESTFAIFQSINKSWQTYRPKAPGGSSVPITWDGDVWKRLRFRSALAVLKTWVGPKGAGPTVSKTKRVTVVVLEHRETGQRVKFLNTHFVPSANRKDLGPQETEARRNAYLKHARRVKRIVEHTHLPVVLTMDANSDGNSSLTAPMHHARLTGWTCVPTHGHNIFDHILSRGLVRAGEQTVEGGSDHRTVVAKFRTSVTTKENPR